MNKTEDIPEIKEKYLVGKHRIEIHREGNDEHLVRAKVGRQSLYNKLPIHSPKMRKLRPEDIETINKEVREGTIPKNCGLVLPEDGTNLSKELLDVLFEASRRGWLPELERG